MEAEPGSADMVKVDVPGIMAAGIGRRGTLAERKLLCHRREDGHSNEGLTPP